MSAKNEADVLNTPQTDTSVTVSTFPSQSDNTSGSDSPKKITSKKTLIYDENGERAVSKTEVRSMTGIVNRQDAFSVDPRLIVVNEETNPRKDYGDDEEWQEHVDSIRAEGVREAIQVYVRDDKSGNRVFHLAQGFRRMRAVMQIIAENPEAIKMVPITITEGNRERTLLDHLTLNTGKKFTEYENSLVVKQLMAWGYDAKDIANMTKFSEIKVRRFVDLHNGASQMVINAIEGKQLSVTAGLELVKNTPDTVEQNKKLVKAKESAQSKVKTAPVAKTPKADSKLVSTSFDDVTTDFDDTDDEDYNPDKIKLTTQPTPVAVNLAKPAVAPSATPLKLTSKDFEDSAVSKKTNASLEFKVSSLMNLVDKESMQFPDDVDMGFVDRVRGMFKMLAKGSSNLEIMEAYFKA